jgi:ribosomal protein S12 methylthiotransferase accessory factor YcaO
LEEWQAAAWAAAWMESVERAQCWVKEKKIKVKSEGNRKENKNTKKEKKRKGKKRVM